MELIGKLVKKLPQETGQGKNGQWVKGAFVVETEEQFPKKAHFTVWGENMISALAAIKEDDQIKVHFSVESREYNERWYTDLRCFRIDAFNPVTPVGTAPAPAQQPSYQPAQPPQQPINEPPVTGSFNTQSLPDEDDLPF